MNRHDEVKWRTIVCCPGATAPDAGMKRIILTIRHYDSARQSTERCMDVAARDAKVKMSIDYSPCDDAWRPTPCCTKA